MSTTTATDAVVVSPVPPEVLRARAYLSRVAEPPAPALGALVEAVGPVDAARLVREGAAHGPHALPPAVAAETAARRGTDRAAADLALLAARGGRLIVPEDPEWPAAALAGLGVAAGPDGTVGLEGAPVRDGLAVPLALWACGPRRLDDAPRRWVGMVGARAAERVRPVGRARLVGGARRPRRHGGLGGRARGGRRRAPRGPRRRRADGGGPGVRHRPVLPAHPRHADRPHRAHAAWCSPSTRRARRPRGTASSCATAWSRR